MSARYAPQPKALLERGHKVMLETPSLLYPVTASLTGIAGIPIAPHSYDLREHFDLRSPIDIPAKEAMLVPVSNTLKAYLIVYASQPHNLEVEFVHMIDFLKSSDAKSELSYLFFVRDKNDRLWGWNVEWFEENPPKEARDMSGWYFSPPQYVSYGYEPK